MPFLSLFIFLVPMCKIHIQERWWDCKNEYKDLYQQFGLNVVYYRKKKRYSQTQLAELVDIHRTYVSSIELGKVSVSFDILFKLAEVLEVPTSKLFEIRE